MPDAACYPSTCPSYTFPTAAQLEALEALPTETTAALTAIDAMKVTSPPMTEVQKCQAYCKAVAQAEAEKARQMREKVAAALKAAGYPSKVTAYGSSKSKSSKKCAPPKSTKKGSCSTGVCKR